MSITAIVKDDAIKLPAGVHLPDGTQVQLELPAASNGKVSVTWPAGYFERTAGALADERFERPAQGETEIREEW